MEALQSLFRENFGFIALIAALFIAARPGKSILLGLRSKNWRRVKAIVASSSLDREGRAYFPKIIYKYSINGREYIDDTFAFALGNASTKAHSIAVVQRHTEGQEILVYVDPENPARSVMEPGVHWSSYMNVTLMVLFISALGFTQQWLWATK